MRRLERGASYVPLIIVLVLLIVALVWAYIKHDEADQLSRQLREQEQKAKQENQDRVDTLEYLRAVSGEVGFTMVDGTSRTKQGSSVEEIQTFVAQMMQNLRDTYVREFPISAYSVSEDGGVVRSESGDTVTIGYIAEGRIRSEATLQDLYSLMDSALGRMLQDIQRLVNDVATEKAKYAAREEQFLATISDKDSEIARLRSEKAAVEAAKAQVERDLSDRIASLETEVRSAEEALETCQEDMKVAVSTRDNQILALKQDVQKLKRRKEMREEPIGPDGQVLAVTSDQGLAVLNRGKADHLQPGTTFNVYTLGKGSQKILKGSVTVLDVDRDSARARILETLNPMNPIVTGDYFESAAYDPDEQLHFYLLGRTRKYGKTDAAARLRDLGQMVDQEVSIDTDYLVLGAPESEDENLRESDAYKRAQELGIRVITEAQLSSFLNY